ncbi:hypothetical protein [Ralstonia solanacearum]|uniref:hypothetical protein n=1 Tax=Ralstonia solanacearum TaxID=305 RepID=UPI001E3D5183|nr:hypothetical protein [Ralstonia solanacearum]
MVEYPPIPAMAVRLVPCLRAQDPQRAAGTGIGAQIGGIRTDMTGRPLAQGHSIETVPPLLGHAELDHVAPYLEVRHELREATAELGDGWGNYLD